VAEALVLITALIETDLSNSSLTPEAAKGCAQACEGEPTKALSQLNLSDNGVDTKENGVFRPSCWIASLLVPSEGMHPRAGLEDFSIYWNSHQQNKRSGHRAPPYYHNSLASPLQPLGMSVPPIMNLASASQVVNRYLASCCDECVTTMHLDACPNCHKSCHAWGLPNTGKEDVRRCLEDALTMENGNDWRSALACQVAEEFDCLDRLTVDCLSEARLCKRMCN
jgi:hypothetical protein